MGNIQCHEKKTKRRHRRQSGGFELGNILDSAKSGVQGLENKLQEGHNNAVGKVTDTLDNLKQKAEEKKNGVLGDASAFLAAKAGPPAAASAEGGKKQRNKTKRYKRGNSKRSRTKRNRRD